MYNLFKQASLLVHDTVEIRAKWYCKKRAHHAMKANEKDQNVSILEFTT